MRNIIQRHHISFKNAWAGIYWAFTTQPNFRVHLSLALLAVCIGLYVQLAAFEWILLIFTIFWGLAAEMINTALEAMTDLITQEWREQAKIAKDVAAGMMMLVSLGAVFVAAFLLLPKLLAKLG